MSKVKAWIRFRFKKGRSLRATKKMLIVLICAKNALSSRHGETFPGIGSLPFSMQVGLKFLCRPTAKWSIYLTIHLTSTDVLLKWYQKYVLTKASSLGFLAEQFVSVKCFSPLALALMNVKRKSWWHVIHHQVSFFSLFDNSIPHQATAWCQIHSMQFPEAEIMDFFLE